MHVSDLPCLQFSMALVAASRKTDSGTCNNLATKHTLCPADSGYNIIMPFCVNNMQKTGKLQTCRSFS